MNLISILQFFANHLLITFIGFALIFVVLKILRQEKQHQAAKKMLAKAVKANMNEPLTLHPEIDPAICSGCGACTIVCPEGDILKMINNKAVLVGPTKCVGHGECERACPVDAISLVFGTKARGMDIPRVSTNYETNVPGLYIAGELGGMGLIRNAVKQGISAATHALSKTSSEPADFDLVVVGAGPAGLAATLVAIAQKKKYLTLEQNGFGGTVYNFPRQKVVMSHPFDLPLVGKMKYESNKVSKEELLDSWNQVRRKTGLKIQEQTQFQTVEKVGKNFRVKTNQGDYLTKKVILAMGVRGSPRKLGVPGEESSKVTYNLLDPEQYKDMDVVVVGGGNAGVEAAQMLGEARWKNRVHLLVRSDQFDRCNEDNILRITKMEKNNLVQIWYNSSISEIRPKEVMIKKNEEILTLPNDFIFIFAGAELPFKFLMGLGVEIEKKFGVR